MRLVLLMLISLPEYFDALGCLQTRYFNNSVTQRYTQASKLKPNWYISSRHCYRTFFLFDKKGKINTYMHGVQTRLCRITRGQKYFVCCLEHGCLSFIAIILLSGKPHLFYLFQANNWKYIVFTGRRPDLMMALSAFTIGNDDIPCNRKNGPSYNKFYNNYDDSFRLYMFQIFFNCYIRRLPTNQLKIPYFLK